MQRKYLLGSNQNELRLEPEAHLVTKFTLLKPTRARRLAINPNHDNITSPVD
jgi:hypothetical protein